MCSQPSASWRRSRTRSREALGLERRQRVTSSATAFYRISEPLSGRHRCRAAVRAAGLERGESRDLIAPATGRAGTPRASSSSCPMPSGRRSRWRRMTVRQTVGHIIGSQRGYGVATGWWPDAGAPGRYEPAQAPSDLYDALPSDEEEEAGTPGRASWPTRRVVDRSAERLAPAGRTPYYGVRWVGFALDSASGWADRPRYIREHTIQVEKTLA